MSRLTPFARLLLVVAIVGGVFFGAKKFFPQLGSKTEMPTLPQKGDYSGTTTSETAPPPAAGKAESKPTAPTGPREAFDYSPPSVSNGKLKGVVELGASGFNSFIVNIDAQKHWEMKKKEFGNSLVMENMATDDDIRIGLKKYIAGMLDYGVAGKDIHFIVSSGAMKAEVTQKIVSVLKSMNYVVNPVTPEQEARWGLKCVQPKEFSDNSFVCDIGSGNTKLAWTDGGTVKTQETFGAKYFQANTTDETVYAEIQTKANPIPASKRKTCFIIGGVPSDLAKLVRTGNERYTVLNAPAAYKVENAKTKAGINIYKAVADATGCKKFVFDWDANFTLGFLLDLK